MPARISLPGTPGISKINPAAGEFFEHRQWIGRQEPAAVGRRTPDHVIIFSPGARVSYVGAIACAGEEPANSQFPRTSGSLEEKLVVEIDPLIRLIPGHKVIVPRWKSERD